MKAIILTVILGIFFIGTTSACDCDSERKSVEDLLKSSKLTFIGTVVSSEKSSLRDSAMGSYYQKVVFKIDSILAGNFSNKEVSIFFEPSSCAPNFSNSGQFLVYAFENQYKVFEAHQCHSPCPEISTEMARGDLRAIRQLRKLRSVNRKVIGKIP